MPSIKCKCGSFVNFSEIPNPNEWVIISDIEFDSFPNNLNKDELYRQMKSMLVCPTCKRILVFWNGFDNDPTFYKPEV
jgi:hypothetical protein